MDKQSESSALDYIRKRASAYINKEDAGFYAMAFLMAMLVHLFVFTNKLTNHDDASALYNNCAFGIISARWLLSTARTAFGAFSSSYLNGLIASACLAAAAVLTADVLRLKSRVSRLLCVLILIAFPSVATTYAYMFVSAPYFFAMLMAVFAVKLAKKETVPALCTAAVLFALSLGIYQAYFALAAALLVITLILDICEGRFESFKDFVVSSVRYVLTLAVGMVLYFIVLKIALRLSGTELLYKAGQIPLSELPRRIFECYLYFCAYYVGHWLTLFPKWFIAVNAVCIAADAWIVLSCIKKQGLLKRPLLLIGLVVLVCVLPLACNLVIVMSGIDTMHHLMIYPLVLPYVFALYALERIPADAKQRFGAAAAAVLILAEALCGYMCVYKSNEAYFTLDMLNKNAQSFYTRVCTRIELTEGFTPETRVAILGHYTPEDNIPDSLFTGIGSLDTFLNMYTKDEYCKLYLAAQYDYLSADEKSDFVRDHELSAMPVYPAEGSVAIIDGVAVVNLG